ncbi:MAG: hypothetical protein AAF629_14515 [Chloroflexota bacterium]
MSPTCKFPKFIQNQSTNIALKSILCELKAIVTSSIEEVDKINQKKETSASRKQLADLVESFVDWYRSIVYEIDKGQSKIAKLFRQNEVHCAVIYELRGPIARFSGYVQLYHQTPTQADLPAKALASIEEGLRDVMELLLKLIGDIKKFLDK